MLVMAEGKSVSWALSLGAVGNSRWRNLALEPFGRSWRSCGVSRGAKLSLRAPIRAGLVMAKGQSVS